MKVVFVLHALTAGGAERVTSLLADGLTAAGHTVTIVTMTEGAEDAYPLDPRVRRLRFALGEPSRNLIQGVWANVRRIRALAGVLKTEDADVAVAMMPSWNVILGLTRAGLALEGRRVRAIGSERIHPPTLPLGRAWNLLRRYAYGLLDVVVAQTGPSRDWLLAHTRARDVRVIPNPIGGVEAGPTAHHPDLPEEAPLLLAVGRMVDQKRFDRVIEAFATQPAFVGWRLALVGDGERLAVLKAQAQEAGVSDRVLFPGTARDIQAWYRRAQLFVLASDFEGFPNVLLEAMAQGLPVAAVDCDTGPRDLIEDGVNGLLVPLGDQAALAQALSRLAGNAELCGRLGEAALSVNEAYALPVIVRRWEGLFTPESDGSAPRSDR